MREKIQMLAVVAFAAGTAQAQGVRDVDCDQESLRRAIATSAPGDTLRISGTCREPVVVVSDRLTLDGRSTAIFDGGVPGGGPFGLNGGAFNATILIDGARGVTVRGFTIRNGAGGGIIGKSNAAFTVEDTTVEKNYFGIVVQDGSHAEVVNTEITGNTDGGMGITNASTVLFRGRVKINQNLEGISASGNCALELLGAQLEASANRTNGIGLSGCSFNIRNFGQQSRMVLNANGADGLFLGGGQFVVGESFFFGFAGEVFHEITAMDNKGSGVNLAGFASLVNLGGARFNLQRNTTGINLANDSSLLTIGGIRAENNGTGILADGAGAVIFVSTPRNPSYARQNGTADMDLRFGTRLTVDGASIGKLRCDGTALSRGSIRCP